MARINVLVVDPDSRRVYEKTIPSGNRVFEKIIGGTPVPCYVWDVFRAHAVCSDDSKSTQRARRWRFRSEDPAQAEVFHGRGVLYRVEASERVSHALTASAVSDRIEWMDDEETAQESSSR